MPVARSARSGKLLAIYLVAPAPAFIQTNGCAGGDFGHDCSLADLTATFDHFARIDNLMPLGRP